MASLHHELVHHEGAAPRGWLLLTHGIFGSGGNWRSIARKLHKARPDMGCVLVDLRNHGRSPSPPPPHDLTACAADLSELVQDLAGRGVPVVAAAGHSFGGKVVAMLRKLGATPRVQQYWMLDSSPSARPEVWTERPSVLAVLETLESLPATFASRGDFERAVTGQGHAVSIAQWLALNLQDAGAGTLRLRLSAPTLREMLTSYWAVDLWSSVRSLDGSELHVVIAERSSTLDAADRQALAACPPHVHAHTVAADHWLHVDAPDAVVSLLAEHLPRP